LCGNGVCGDGNHGNGGGDFLTMFFFVTLVMLVLLIFFVALVLFICWSSSRPWLLILTYLLVSHTSFFVALSCFFVANFHGLGLCLYVGPFYGLDSNDLLILFMALVVFI
jgi:hypothetical protein